MSSRVYRPDERPDVEVLVDGVWHQGELRAWQQRDDGSWWANVQWRPAPGETYLDTVPAANVRPDVTEPRSIAPESPTQDPS